MPVQTATKFKLFLVLLNILNIADGILTQYWLSIGRCSEFNPFMALFSSNPLYFWTVKLTLVGVGSILLYKQIEYFLTQMTIIVLTIFYFGIVAYHLWFGI